MTQRIQHSHYSISGLLLALFGALTINTSFADEAEQLTLAYRLDSAPLQFQNNKGKADGILVDFWKLWSHKSGIPVTFKGGYNKQAQAMLIDGQAEINIGLFANEKRARNMDFSLPILDSPYHLYVHNTADKDINIHNLRDYRVGVTSGSFHETYMREHFPAAKLLSFDGYQALFKAAADGTIRAFISQPMYRSYYLQQQSLKETYRTLEPPLYTHSYRAAVAKNQPKLLQTINRNITLIDEDEKATISRKWLGPQWHTGQIGSNKTIQLSTEEKNWIEKHRKIRMGGESNWPPFDFADDQGNYQGIAADYIRILEDRLGTSIQIEYEQSWTETLGMLQNGQLDAVAAISRTPDREKYALFTAPYASYPYAIITHKKDIALDSLQSLTGKRVAVERNFYTYHTLRSKYPQIDLVINESTEDAILAVSKGKADAYIGVQPVATYFMDKNFITNLRMTGEAPFDKVGISMAVRADIPVLAKLLQKGLDSISPAEKLAIQRKWLRVSKDYSIPHHKISLSDKQKTWINSHKTLRIGIDPNWPPIEYFDSKGVYSGIASDYIQLFENTFNIKTDYDSSLKWNDVIEQVKSGKIDVLPAVSKTQEREKYLNFTEPYLRFPYVIFMRNDAELITGLDELIGKTVVVERNYANHDILKSNYPNINLLLVDDTEQALSAISLGNADAYMGNLAATSHIMLQIGHTNIKVAAPTPYSNDLAFAVRKDLKELPGILQQFLDSISIEQANLFKKRWFSIQYEHKVDYALLWNTISIGVFILFITSLWLWMLNKQKEALRVSEERFRLVMNATQEGIWDWNIATDDVYYSPGFYSMLGYLKKDFPKKYGAWLNLLHPDDYEKIKTSLNTIISNCTTPYTLEFLIMHNNGQYRCVQATGSIELDQDGKAMRSLGSLTDITEKKNAQEKLQQREQQLKDIIDAIPLAIVISNDDGDIIFANKQTEKEIGSNNSVIGLNMKLFYVDPLDRTRLLQLYKEKGRIDAFPMRYKTLSGEITEGIISLLPVYFDGGMNNLGVLVNLTERMQMERELVTAKEQADIANKTKSSFLANMSHEIRTPMNAVIGLSHLVLKTELNNRQHDYIEKIHSSAHTLLGIINDILDFSKIEAGKLEIENIEFQLEDTIENLSSLVALRAEEKDLEILFCIDPDVPLHLLGDPLRLGQILINLTQNAIKFTDHGEILVEVHQIELQNDVTKLEFSVTDTGIGIDKEHIEHLFDAFSQVDQSHTRRFGGTGLGLAICQQLVELMGGDIIVKSEPGKGSRFSFQLPFKVLQTQRDKTLNISFAGKRALVVDDNAIARQVLTSMLETFSFEVEAAKSGQEALLKIHQAAAVKDRHFDLVLLDWKMPGLNGIETSRAIHEEVDQPHIPTIIMVTSYGREEIMHQAEQIGLDGFLIKPINSSLLYNSILEAMQGASYRSQNIAVDMFDQQITGEILLVEDNKINQQVAQEILENMGLHVLIVNDGEEALKTLENNNIDIILTDIQMPVVDGYELAHRIRQHSKWHKLPVIAMTAHAMAGDREKCLAAGMNDHVPKPIDPSQLFKALKKWLPTGHPGLAPDKYHDIPIAQLPDSIAGIDMEWGLRRIGGNQKLFYKLLREFIQDYAEADQQVEAAIADNKLEQARLLLHTIEGIAGNIGAQKLQEASRNMGDSLHHGTIPEQSRRDFFLESFKEVSTSLKMWLETGNQVFTENINRNIKLDRALLARIDQLLMEGSPEAGSLLARIDQSTLDTNDAKLISAVVQNVQRFDFSHARSALSKLQLWTSEN